MVNTLWSDISEFQVPVNDRYPYHVLEFRSNDGSHLDAHFTQNIAWARSALHNGRLWAYIVYYFYRPGIDGAQILMNRVGKPDSRMIAMIDVESASGQVRGDQSGPINAQFSQLAKWLGNDKRVIGYGNVSDLDSLWPNRPRNDEFIIAAYGSNPSFPHKFAHQFLDNANTPPFGPSDLNSADGYSEGALEALWGLVPPRPPSPPGNPNVHEFDGKTSIGAVAKSRNYATASAWLAHEVRLNANDADKMLEGAIPPAGTVWRTQ